jgi:hypothetical protein
VIWTFFELHRDVLGDYVVMDLALGSGGDHDALTIGFVPSSHACCSHTPMQGMAPKRWCLPLL